MLGWEHKLAQEPQDESKSKQYQQQSISNPKPSDVGQLFDPQLRPSWHSWWVSQSPSFSPQGVIVVQKFSSPIVAL